MCRVEIDCCMRRFLALLMVFAGLIGACAPAFACAPGAAGNCCPPNAPGCTPAYEQFGVEPSMCCVAAADPVQMIAAEPARDVQERNPGSPGPNVLPVSSASSPELRAAGTVDAPLFSARCTDASLTYLHTGRLRL